MQDFGLAHLKGEGMPSHPDDINMGALSCKVNMEGWTDEKYKKWYAKQLKAYYDAYPGEKERLEVHVNFEL